MESSPPKSYWELYRRSSAGEGVFNTYVYRILSLAFVWLGVRLRITPNQLTYLSFLMSVIAVIFFVQGEYHLALIGLIPFHLGKIIDCADGQLAMFTNKKSTFGAFLDPFLDRVVDLLTFAALSYWAAVYTGSHASVWLLVILLSLWFLSSYLSRVINMSATDVLKGANTKAPPRLRMLIRWDMGFFSVIVTLAVVFAQIPLLIGLYILVAAPACVAQYIKAVKVARNGQA